MYYLKSRVIIPESRLVPGIVKVRREPGALGKWLGRTLEEPHCKTCRFNCCDFIRLRIHPDDPNFDAFIRLVKNVNSSSGRDGLPGYFEPIHTDMKRKVGCPLVHEGQCPHYDVRPEPCRTYPLMGADNPDDSFIRVVAIFDCPAVLKVLSIFRTEFLFVSELVEVNGDKLKPKVPFLGNALIALLAAKSPLHKGMKFDNSEHGPIVRLTPYDLSYTSAITGVRL